MIVSRSVHIGHCLIMLWVTEIDCGYGLQVQPTMELDAKLDITGVVFIDGATLTKSVGSSFRRIGNLHKERWAFMKNG